MKVRDILERLKLAVLSEGDLDAEVKNGYTCDLLSEVMGKAQADTVWITVQTHVNIIAVATVVGIRMIILCNGHEVPEDMLNKAKKEQITVARTGKNPFEISCEICKIGIR
ncbi:MAG: iron-sulfur binding hydrogenase [Thermotoga sp.]|nr:MAG: iron-sulfur binding hydrogenase [Thermotoga sp.]